MRQIVTSSFLASFVFLGIPAAQAQLQVQPSGGTLGPGQQQQFSLVSNGVQKTASFWSTSPSGAGTITAGGLYTAPSAISAPRTVYVIATINLLSGANQYTTPIQLLASSTTTSPLAGAPALPVSVSVAPTSVSLLPSQTQNFTASVSGTTNTAVTWSVVPNVGTVVNGLYTAPATISAQQTVTVIATSAADPTKTASAAVNLGPAPASSTLIPAATVSVSISVSPTTASLTAGQSQQLTASVSGATNTAVTWSLVPNVGTISNGLYVAPAAISTAQTVTVVATSQADTTKSASAALQLQPASTSSTSTSFTPIRVSCGNGQYTDPQGVVWAADYGWSGSPSTGSTTTNIAGTTLQGLYQHRRLGPNFVYSFAVPTGTYNVTLKFAEAAYNSAGQRVFDVAIDNQPVLSSFDIVAQAGGPFRAIDKSFNVTASSGQINLQFTGLVSNAEINGISISQLTAGGGTPVPPPNVGVAVTPTVATLTGGQSLQFNASVSGTSNTAVSWSVSPAIGTVSGGLYTAPSVVQSLQTVTLTATSAADPSKTTSATITLLPISVTLTPSSVSLSGGKSSSFTASVTGTTNTGVTWSLAPAVGTVANGVYTAPATITALQTIVLTAASVANPAQAAQATITLTPAPAPSTVSPSQVTLQPSQTQQFAVTGGTSTTISWSISPAVGSITQSGLFTAPSTISTQQAVTVTARDAVSSAVLGSGSVTLTPAPPTSSPIKLPVEVFGPDGTTVPVSFNLPSSSNLGGPLQLWLQVHGIKYQTQASVQVNGGSWIPINDSNITLLGQAKNFGGIGGGFATLKLTINLPSGSINQGLNTVTFRFNGTNGISSGFRVLNLNVLAGGNQLISQDNFVEDDPSGWQPPLNTSADILAGLTLWKTANLTAPGFGAMQAKCGTCHTQDGRDLKYFNYSNLSIRVRSMFHGLTAQQGDQIASYIRSLNTPAPASARPWNPPYQPGPGMDSRPVSEWAAGAGIDAVLDHDADMLPYLMPGGSTANWAWNAYLNAREMPIPLQLLDWNRWLPTIHPLDGWGSAFTISSLNSVYLTVRSQLQPNDPTSYKAVAFSLQTFGGGAPGFQGVMFASTNWTDPTYVQKVYSVSQWSMVKLWEINQEFGLEGMAPTVFGPQSADRAWYTTEAFGSSPTFGKIPRPSLGLDNGTTQVHIYLSFSWYQLQMILNDGNGTASGSTPVDWGYALSFPENDLTAGLQTGTAGLMLEWLAKALQSGLTAGGGNPTNPRAMVVYPGQVTAWSEVSSAQKISLMNAWVRNWFDRYRTLTLQQLLVTHQAWPTVDFTQKSIETDLAKALPQLRFQGVDANLLNQVVAWASSVWPAYNWSGALNAPCSAGNGGEVKCTVQ